ncbi:MAG: integrase arm-type DNA-binding domain-containing protein [Burkholderiales bacterium]
MKDGKLKAIAISRGDLPLGRHNDGRGLYLVIRPGSQAWVFRYRDRVTGKLRDMGLGALADLSLAGARKARDQVRSQLLAGVDPINEKRTNRAAALLSRAKLMTFGECADAYIAAHAAGWRSPKHRQQWTNTLTTHAAMLRPLPVSEITTDLVLRCLEPIWRTRTETASRVRQRIEAVLDWATVRKFRSGDNPARWRGHLDALLPAPGKVAKAEHHAALAWADLPAFAADLRARSSLSARALEFTILTACRAGEVAAARWSEIDLDAATWTIPGDRMKAGVEHRVPLSARAVAILEALPRTGVYVFPGLRGHLNPESMRKFLQVDMGHGNELTVHGFRSSFRDWAAESTAYPGEVVEMALAHTIKNKAEAAYRRGDLLAKRAKLMQAWADYVQRAPNAGSVAPIRQAG